MSLEVVFATSPGGTIADVFLYDGTTVNYTLVKDGWCWWYRKYAPGDAVLEEIVGHPVSQFSPSPYERVIALFVAEAQDGPIREWVS